MKKGKVRIRSLEETDRIAKQINKRLTAFAKGTKSLRV